MKHVTIIVRKSPFSSILASEALRMSVGLIIMNNKIRVILADEGVFNLCVEDHTKINGPEVTRHLQTLREFGCEIIAEQESIRHNKIQECAITVCLKSKQEIAQLLCESNYVISI